MVGSNPHCPVQRLALLHQRGEQFADFLLFRFELSWIIIIDFFKLLGSISKISWVDSDLFKCLCHHHGDRWLEMNVSHKRCIVSIFEQLLSDGHARLGLLAALNSNSDHVCSSISTSFHLLHRGCHVSRVCRCHCLQSNWVLAADPDVPNLDGTGGSSSGLVYALAVLWGRKHQLLAWHDQRWLTVSFHCQPPSDGNPTSV
mmetsp:Transcript_7006/g.13963  ORF Transcript_7006/g.13963 Transcript_7006/m.13963 type:complete len:201 (+) Transcript_7006:684-1286(+)